MTSEGLGEMFEGDSADTCGGKFPLMSIWGRADVLLCADPEARTQIGASGNLPMVTKMPHKHVSPLTPKFTLFDAKVALEVYKTKKL